MALETAHGALQTRRFAGGVAWVRANVLTSYEYFRAILLGAFDIVGGTSKELDEHLNVHLHRAPCLILLDGVDEARKSEEVWNWALALPLPTQILATSRLALPDTKRFEIVTVTESGTFGIVAKSVQSAGYYLKQVRQHADLNQKVNLDWFDREWPKIYTAAKLAVEQEDYNSLIDFINSTSEYSTLRDRGKRESSIA